MRSQPVNLIIKTQRVLDHAGRADAADPGYAHFWQVDEDTGAITTSLTMRPQDWQDMDSPSQVTIAVTPGDNLNGD